MYVSEKAKAKINLSLKILNKRNDGYHNLISHVVFTDIGDKVSIKILKKQTRKIKIIYKGLFANDLPKDQSKNLISKAVKCFYKEFSLKKNITISLYKNVPVSSGIGGGSSDTALIIKLIPKIFGIKNDKKLKMFQHKVSKTLGSDILACLYSRPLKMLDTGNKISNIDLSFKKAIRKNNWITLVNPNKKIITKNIFKNYNRSKNSKKNFLKNNIYNPNNINDLKYLAEKSVPEIIIAQKFLSKQKGIKFVGMSGSGPTCFGIFKKDNQAKNAVNNIKKCRPKWWVKKGKILT